MNMEGGGGKDNPPGPHVISQAIEQLRKVGGILNNKRCFLPLRSAVGLVSAKTMDNDFIIPSCVASRDDCLLGFAI